MSSMIGQTVPNRPNYRKKLPLGYLLKIQIPGLDPKSKNQNLPKGAACCCGSVAKLCPTL